MIGRENILEDMNRQALKIARDVADRHGCLMAGDICNTNAYEADDKSTHAAVRGMFEEQISWAVEEKADFLIAETIDGNGIQARTTSAIQSGSGPDIIMEINNWAQLYAASVMALRRSLFDLARALAGGARTSFGELTLLLGC